jgi:hypothetical protein
LRKYSGILQVLLWLLFFTLFLFWAEKRWN